MFKGINDGTSVDFVFIYENMIISNYELTSISMTKPEHFVIFLNE